MKQGTIFNFLNKNKNESQPQSQSTNINENDSKKMQTLNSKSSKIDIAQFKQSTSIVLENITSGKELKIDNNLSLLNSNSKEVKVENISINKIDTESILFNTVVQVLIEIEKCKGEKSKSAIKENFAKLFKDIILNFPNDLIRCFYFLLTKIGPEYKTPELGIGGETIVKCVAKAVGKNDKYLKAQTTELGDLALVAAKCKETQGTMDVFLGKKNSLKKGLTLKKVIDDFRVLSYIKGKASFAEKEKILVKLMFESNQDELKFIVRYLQGSLCIGAAFKTVISALSRAISKIYQHLQLQEQNIEYTIIEKDIDRILLITINQLSDYEIVCENIIKCINQKIDISNLISLCPITPGIPVKPMLAKPTTGLDIIVKRFDGIPFTCEYKYDGFRGQVHYFLEENGKICIEIFSRNNENMTETYPDLIEYFRSTIDNEKIKNFILDCEVVPYDNLNNKILPFQVLTTRARKNVILNEITTDICIFIFDIIYLNSEVVIDKTLNERRMIISNNFIESKYIRYAKYLDSEDLSKIQDFMTESINDGCEGLIIKALYKNSSYQPGQRNFNWLKLKKDYLETSIGDSLDLVPIAADYGKGYIQHKNRKRTGTFGSFLLACYNDETECYETLTKTATGLKDEDLKRFYEIMKEYIIQSPRNDYVKGDVSVDVWFEPKLVWEIKTADLSLSPIYTAAINEGEEKRGISLRFPRFIRERPDKLPHECTTSKEVYQMYTNQAFNNKNKKEIEIDNEDEFYD